MNALSFCFRSFVATLVELIRSADLLPQRVPVTIAAIRKAKRK